MFANPMRKKTPSIILGQSQGFPSRAFTKESYSVVYKAHLIEDDTPKLCAAQYRTCCKTPSVGH